MLKTKCHSIAEWHFSLWFALLSPLIGHLASASSEDSSSTTESRHKDEFVNSRRIREFLPRLRPAQIELHNFFPLVNRRFGTLLAFDMRMPPLMKGISTHETDTWNIAGRRSWISDDALDFGFARPRNSVGKIAQKALSNFCEAYWPPLYAFLRHRGHASPEAQDLVQGFFAHLLEQNTLSRADQEKGRLRTFLLGSMQNFLFNEYDRARALKRGGGHQIVSIDEHLPEAEASMMDTMHLSDSALMIWPGRQHRETRLATFGKCV